MNLKKTNEPNSINLIREIFKGYKIDINEKYIEILINLKNKKDEREFLFDKKNNSEIFFKKIRNINNDNNNSFFGFEKCILFIGKFINYQGEKGKKDKDIISEFKNTIKNNEDIYSNFQNFFDKYSCFKDNFLLI